MAKTHLSMLRMVAAATTVLAACSAQDPGTNQQSPLGDVHPERLGGAFGIGHDAKVMTRNLYLGANLSPAIGALSPQALVSGAGVILRQVTTSNFPVRAKGLAAEILRAKPDLVGLQECALWRTGPVDFDVLTTGPSATTVRYDFLQLLLDELNKGPDKYEAVAVENEFDFEAPADEDDNPATGGFYGADINGRLTMRDVILARTDSGVHVEKPEGGHYQNLLGVPLFGAPDAIRVTRGWVKVEARVRGGLPFRFVDTHLEAFDDGHVREQQALELAEGPAHVLDEPVVLVGDLNSGNASDNISGDDQLAYAALIDHGFYERSTNHPYSCCINSETLQTGTAADFTHRVDHIMTDAPRKVRLVFSFVTGRRMHNGYWDSDHAGVVSRLRLR